MKKRVYISIPISGHDIWSQRLRAIEVAMRFRQEGYDFFIPYVIIPDGDLYESIFTDLKEFLRCDILVLIDDWETSEICRCKADLAKDYGIEIRIVTT
jgi:hypothetical protein